MDKEKQIANRFYEMYQTKYGKKIDQMKLHKLMYFAQRENLVVYDKPLFDEQFSGWKYGPVLRSVRNAYMKNELDGHVDKMSDEEEAILQVVFDRYSEKTSWSLSRLTHGEYSWLQSRKGISEGENGNRPILIKDIRIDANRIKSRREKRKILGLD